MKDTLVARVSILMFFAMLILSVAFYFLMERSIEDAVVEMAKADVRFEVQTALGDVSATELKQIPT